MSSRKSFWAALAALSLWCALAAAPAQATTLAFSPAGAVSLSGSATFRDASSIFSFNCAYTFDGTLNAGAVADAPGTQIGQLEVATVSTCSGPSFVGLLYDGEPWPLTFEGWVGTAPGAVTGMRVKISDWAFQFHGNVLGVAMTCLYTGDVTGVIELSGSNPYATGSLVLDGNLVPKLSGGASCPSTGRWNGTLALSPSQAVTVV